MARCKPSHRGNQSFTTAHRRSHDDVRRRAKRLEECRGLSWRGDRPPPDLDASPSPPTSTPHPKIDDDGVAVNARSLPSRLPNLFPQTCSDTMHLLTSVHTHRPSCTSYPHRAPEECAPALPVVTHSSRTLTQDRLSLPRPAHTRSLRSWGQRLNRGGPSPYLCQILLCHSGPEPYYPRSTYPLALPTISRRCSPFCLRY